MNESKLKRQVAALPVCHASDGQIRVLLITSRETGRFVLPKGWTMKGRPSHRAAAIEAEEEAGIVGRVHARAIGRYRYQKRLPTGEQLCEVRVFLLEAREQLQSWREQRTRRQFWMTPEDAAAAVDELGLAKILRGLPEILRKRLTGPGPSTPGPMQALLGPWSQPIPDPHSP